MKPEEALKELSYGGKCTCEARMTAIDALEKQIPKKMVVNEIIFPYNLFTSQKCANCGNPIVGNKIYKYCPECGQRLKWREEDEL